MTTNKVCGKGKCKFTDEFCMSGDCPYDTENMLKNQKKFNISEGNVKDDNIKSGKTKHGDFIVKYLEEGSHYKVKEINVMENVAQRNSQDLTEQWKKGELEIDNNYYLRFADGTEEIQLYIGGFLMRADNEVVEVLAEVPDYIEWKNYVNGYCEEHEYNLKLSAENQRLKSLLKECREVVEFTKTIVNKHTWFDKILIKINGALK